MELIKHLRPVKLKSPNLLNLPLKLIQSPSDSQRKSTISWPTMGKIEKLKTSNKLFILNKALIIQVSKKNLNSEAILTFKL
jgi:hypothetical protein